MPKEGKQNKHETKIKHHKRKHDKMEPGKLSAPEKNDEKKKISLYGGYLESVICTKIACKY